MNNKLFKDAFMDSWSNVLEQRQFIDEPEITSYRSFKYTSRYLTFIGIFKSIGNSLNFMLKIFAYTLHVIFLKPYLYIAVIVYMFLRFIGIDIFPPLGDSIMGFFKLFL